MGGAYPPIWFMGKKKHKQQLEPYGIELSLSSGFVVFISPLPPYYKDVVNETLPMPEYPKREITLAAGDVVYWPYEPPEEPLEEGDEDFELYATWKAIYTEREEIDKQRKKARMDFLLANCVTVLEGPIDFEDEEWVALVEATFADGNYVVPEHWGKRYLIFLKTQVIKTSVEMESILQSSLSPEVSMQGILNALRGFRNPMGQGRHSQSRREFTEKQIQI